MKKSIFVLFCQKNLTRPKIYKTLPPVLKKVKEHKTLAYKGFEDMTQAQIFMHPKSLEYLKQFDKFQQKGINLQKFQKEKDQELNQQTSAENKEKKAIKKLIDEMYEQIKVKNSRNKRNKKEQQKKQQTPVIWLLVAFENKNLLSQNFISNAKNMREYSQKLQNCQMLASKVHITEQKLSQSLDKILQHKSTQKKPRKSRKYMDFEKFELKNEPELNKLIRQIFQQIVLIQGRKDENHANFVITRPEYPVTAEDQCLLMISAHKQQKTKRFGLAYVIKKMDGTLLIACQHPCDIVTDNQAWFTSLLFGLCDCYGNKINKLKIFCENQHLIKLMQGKTEVDDPKISTRFLLAKLLASKFGKIQYELVNSQMNVQAKDMAKLAARNIVL